MHCVAVRRSNGIIVSRVRKIRYRAKQTRTETIKRIGEW